MKVIDSRDVTVHLGDSLDVMRSDTLGYGHALGYAAPLIPADSIDAIVTDPPYGLGFMGKAWDDLPPGEEWARECLRVLKPGGFLLAFGGSRTWHRLAVAIEDAGFEMRDSIAWLYGSGFPKSLDVSKAIDKAAGAEREIIGYRKNLNRTVKRGDASAFHSSEGGMFREDRDTFADTAPATPDAERWQGWGTALKPAFEPLVCARKPFSPVPSWETVTAVHHALGGLLWLSVSPVRRAALTSSSSPHVLPEGSCASALANAGLRTSPDASEVTDTFRSPALESTASNIASSWSAILAVLSDPTTTFTTSTASSTTIALRTLNSLLAPITSPTTMPKCGCLTDGPLSTAPSADSPSSVAWANWRHTLSRSAPETAIEGIALAAASALAAIAEELSGDRAAGSSAPTPATTAAESKPGSTFEPIVVARKPLAGTVAANVLAYGTGALNIDACRTAGVKPDTTRGASIKASSMAGALGAQGRIVDDGAGRWPTNVVLDGSQADELDAQTGVLTSGALDRSKITAQNGDGWRFNRERSGTYAADSGGASRFFPTFRYEAKAPVAERPRVGGVAHPTVKPLDLMCWLVRLVTPPGGLVLDPFLGSGTTAEACVVEGFRCIGIEREADYLPLIKARLNKPLQPAIDFGTPA